MSNPLDMPRTAEPPTSLASSLPDDAETPTRKTLEIAAETGQSPPGRRLVDGRTAAAKVGCSYRHWLRLCDAGLAPYGIKLIHLRRWRLDELDAWIAGGCKPVRRGAGR